MYLSNVTNLAFHDLTNGKVQPGANVLCSALAINHKFVPTPRFTFTMTAKDVNENLFRFRRDLYRATFWGEDSDEESEDKAAPHMKPKVKLPSEWTPEAKESETETEIPDEITHRVMCFFDFDE